MSMAQDFAPARPFTLGQVGSVIEIGALLLFLLIFSGGLIGPLIVEKASADDLPFIKLIYYPVYVAIILLIMGRPWTMANAVMRSFLLLLPVLLALASTYWSIDPADTFRRSIALLMTTLFAIYLASRLDWGDLIELLATCFAILAVMSFLLAVLAPSKGIMQETFPGAWAGLWYEKNDLGMNMAKSAHLSLCAMIFRPRRRWLWGSILALAIVLVLLSTSKTSLLALVLGLGGVLGLYLFRKGPIIGIPLVYFAVVFGVALTLGIEYAPKFMFGLIGKDPGLTGRTDIWAALATQIKDHPWLGHGYAVFWLDETGPAFWVRQRTQWLVPTAHNGWLETWLSIGLVGVLMFALTYISAIIAALRGLLRDKAAYWALISTLVFLLFSISESNILQQNNLGWIMFAATAAKLFGAKPLRAQTRHKNAAQIP
jgi:exopolysaccharide production protein ExoQ